MQRRNVLQLTGATLATAVGVGWLATGEEAAQEDPIEFDDPEELLLEPSHLPGDGWVRVESGNADVLDVEVTYVRELDEGDGQEGNGDDEEGDGQDGTGDEEGGNGRRGNFWLVKSAVAGREDADAGANLYEQLKTDFVERVGEARVMDLDLASEALIAGYDGLTTALFRDVNCVAAVSFTDCTAGVICTSHVARTEGLARTQRESWRAPADGGDGGEGQLEVAEIHEDAQGNDHDNPNDEYVVFRNAGGARLDLTGWRVEDEAEHAYRFPGGFTLDGGQEVTLYSGRGQDTDSELYWGSEQAIWNNGGDTVFVYDENGEVVVEREYD